MQVKHLKLWNFRGIEYLSIEFTQRTTAFVGVNGVGKSTVLDALAIALSQLTWRVNGHPQKARAIAQDDIRLGADFSRIEITVELHGNPVCWAIVLNRKASAPKDHLRRSDLEALNAVTKTLREAYEAQTLNNLPLAVYYDVNRAVLDVPLRAREKLDHNPYEAYQDALDHGGADFKRFFIWFRNLEDVENEMLRDDPASRERGLEATRHAVEAFTGFSNLRVRRKPKMRMMVTKKGQEFNVLQLSDGERNMLALVGDMARRLSVLNFFGLDNLNEGSGVVLIDEMDLHLHPRWQREMVSKLETTFPNCQFIVSTHSPQVVGELQAESVMLLRDGKFQGHALRALGLSSGEVLEELMEGTSRNAHFQTKIIEIERAIEDENYDQARTTLQAVRTNFGQLPEVLRLEESLEWFDPTEKIDGNPSELGTQT